MSQLYPPTTRDSTFTLQSAGRAGRRHGKISELTVIMPLKPGGADRLRAKLPKTPEEDVVQAQIMQRVGTVHDMRFVIFDNDTRLLFATAYDGDWDMYINDFAATIPETLDNMFSEVEGYPGIRSPEVKDFILKYQVTAASWYCAYPEVTVKEVQRGQRVLKAFEQLLDAAGN